MEKEDERLYQYNHYRHLVYFHNFSFSVLFKKYIEELNKHNTFHMGGQIENDVIYILDSIYILYFYILYIYTDISIFYKMSIEFD